jgi:hypothetical protein
MLDGRGRCAQHRRTTTQRGYGLEHQRARRRLAATLPAPCGYCGRIVRVGEKWAAAHRVDGVASSGVMVAHPACNERGKWGVASSRVNGRLLLTATRRERYV